MYNKDKNKLLVILGGGESGVGVALLAKKHHFNLFLSDGYQIKEIYRKELLENGIPFEEKKHSWNLIKKAELVVISPGISNDTMIVKKIKEKKIPIISEIEFGYRFVKSSKIIAVTGTNGKTTVSHLIYTCIKASKHSVILAGNVGIGFCRKLIDHSPDFWVLEVSNFQLEYIVSFRPHIALLLNITPDHLDRYTSIEEYIQAKYQIVKNMNEENIWIYPSEDSLVMSYFHTTKEKKMKKIAFEKKNIIDNSFHFSQFGKKFSIDLHRVTLKGEHNKLNIVAVIKVLLELEIPMEELIAPIYHFSAIPHRFQWIATIGKLSFINDSKGTNLVATMKALESAEKKIMWIAGGKDKGNDYRLLFPFLKTKIVCIIAIGKDNSKLLEAFEDKVKIILCNTMQEVVSCAWEYRNVYPYEIVLLSPACASFDRFKNFEERGELFVKEVKKLEKLIHP